MVRRILATVLAFLVLVSTTGVVLATHSCRAGTQRSVSLFEGKNCCSEENTTCEKGASHRDHLVSRCCVTEYTYHRSGAPATQPGPDARVAIVPFSVVSLQPPFPTVAVTIPSVLSPFPDPSGRQLLHSIGRLLI